LRRAVVVAVGWHISRTAEFNDLRGAFRDVDALTRGFVSCQGSLYCFLLPVIVGVIDRVLGRKKILSNS
jgi:hypothetical protein